MILPAAFYPTSMAEKLVEVEPFKTSITTVEIAEGFITTSGDDISNFIADYSAHQIFDPKTMHSPQDLSSTTVQASTGAEADAYATAMMVLGLEKSLTFARRKNLNTCLIGKNGHYIKA
jgi:FAD:protein FMN transferase